MDIKDKALITIEGLAILAMSDDNNTLVYKFAHIANGHCKNPHKPWVKELDKAYKQLRKSKVIS